MTTRPVPNKPIPEPEVDTKEFWKATKRHELLIQRCRSCGVSIFYPQEVCPHCLSPNLEWVKASGKGRVYSYTVVRQAPSPAFANDLPYVVAIVQLDEGPKLMAHMADCKIEDVKVDMPVTVVFEDVSPEIAIPKFKPA